VWHSKREFVHYDMTVPSSGIPCKKKKESVFNNLFSVECSYLHEKREVLADYDSSSIAAKLPDCNLVSNL